MSISLKKLRKIIILSLVLFIILSGLLSVYFSYLHHYKGKTIINEWNDSDEFNIDDIQTLEKSSDKDFVILNLTDIQLADIEDFFHRETIRKEIDYLIKEAKPDLITLTGDQVWSNENLISLKLLIKWLDSYKIPYAPIFGNHDYGNEFNSAVSSREYSCDLYEKGKYCLFKRGPSNLDSLGNYVINITENNKIIKTLYLIDAGYNDVISDNQINWLKWNAEGIKICNQNSYSSGICFLHKPIDMYAEAYYAYRNNNAISYYDTLVMCSLYGIDDNGLYNLGKTIGIDSYVCGHQHTNSFTIKYDNTLFTFALKTGELSFYYDDGKINYNGGTIIKIKSDSTLDISNIYVDRDTYHIEGSTNQYNEW